RVLKGVRLDENRPLTLRVFADKAAKDGELFRVRTEMRGTGASGREVLHARADILLTARLPSAARKISPVALPPYRLDKADIYQALLFHGPDLQGIVRVEG